MLAHYWSRTMDRKPRKKHRVKHNTASWLPYNAAKPWDAKMDLELQRRVQAGLTVSEIAQEFSRTEAGIKTRMARLGIGPTATGPTKLA